MLVTVFLLGIGLLVVAAMVYNAFVQAKIRRAEQLRDRANYLISKTKRYQEILAHIPLNYLPKEALRIMLKECLCASRDALLCKPNDRHLKDRIRDLNIQMTNVDSVQPPEVVCDTLLQAEQIHHYAQKILRVIRRLYRHMKIDKESYEHVHTELSRLTMRAYIDAELTLANNSAADKRLNQQREHLKQAKSLLERECAISEAYRAELERVTHKIAALDEALHLEALQKKEEKENMMMHFPRL